MPPPGFFEILLPFRCRNDIVYLHQENRCPSCIPQKEVPDHDPRTDRRGRKTHF